jgi:NhaA family Na+:H+ antiporter
VSLVRSERAAAGILLGAAVLGIVLANTPVGPALIDLKNTEVGPAALHLRLSLGGWIADGLLAVFFFIVAVELRHELTSGELNSVRKALHPAIAAVCGVVVPAGIYLAIAAGSGHARGWPIPTATDIAFALGVLAVFGRGLPRRIRVFLLALAVLDDLIAIIIIAVFFTTDPHLFDLLLAALGVVAFWLSSRIARGRMRAPVGVLMVLIAALTWVLVHASGVHPTIAGVALGLTMSPQPARRTTRALEPWSNGLILPLFAFAAALVPFPSVGISALSAPFWGVLVALPVGKFVGITFGAWLGGVVGTKTSRTPLSPSSILAVATLGGIGFTVSLLMNELAFAADHEVADQGTLAVLLGSAVSMVAGGITVWATARANRRRHPTPQS